MAVLLQKMPIYENPTTVHFPNGSAMIGRRQLLAWVSLGNPLNPSNPDRIRNFPAIIDTGFNDIFLIREHQFTAWTGIRPRDLVRIATTRALGGERPIYAADIWLHPNLPGHERVKSASSAWQIPAYTGIIVVPSAVRRPRLPLLGLRALELAKLQIHFHWQRRAFSLRTAAWWDRLCG